MDRRSFYYNEDEIAGEGYPYRDEERLRRSPYEERRMSDVSRENDPYISPRQSERRPRRPISREDPPPLLTFTASPRELAREMQRGSVPPEERRGPYDSIVRGSETPPPRLRGTRRRVDTFEDRFGDLERPARGSGEQLDRGAPGPSPDPLRRPQYGPERGPYGGGRPPQNPFRPGGGVYDYEQETGSRHPSLEPPDRSRYDEQARRRDEHYRSGIGEPWGLAEFTEYDERRRRERHVLRARQRGERLRRREREIWGQGGEEEDRYEGEENPMGRDFPLFDD